MKDRVLKALLKAHEFEIPESLVDMEIDVLRREMLENMKRYGLKEADLKQFTPPREMFEANARERVASGLVLAEIIRDQKVEADGDRLTAKLEEISKQFPNAQEAMAAYRNNDQLLQNIKAVVLEDQVVEKVLDSATIKEVTMDYDDIVNWRQKAAEAEQKARAEEAAAKTKEAAPDEGAQ